MNQHDYCRALLADARWRASEARIKLPKNITTNSSAFGTNRQFQIVTDEEPAGPWIGRACCSYEAKAKWIIGLVDEKIKR